MCVNVYVIFVCMAFSICLFHCAWVCVILHLYRFVFVSLYHQLRRRFCVCIIVWLYVCNILYVFFLFLRDSVYIYFIFIIYINYIYIIINIVFSDFSLSFLYVSFQPLYIFILYYFFSLFLISLISFFLI